MMTKAEAISNHRKLWHWIAEETRKLKRKVKKSEYFKQNNIPNEPIPAYFCYCCEYAEQFRDDCTYCSIDWGNTENECSCSYGLYLRWNACNDEDWKRAADLADKIAEMPEKIFTDKEGSN